MVVHLRLTHFVCVCLTDTNFLRDKVKMTCGANADALCGMVKGSERFIRVDIDQLVMDALPRVAFISWLSLSHDQGL